MAGRNTADERLRRRFLEGFLEACLLAAGDFWDWMGASNLHYSGWQVLALEGGWLRKAGIHGDARIWAMNTRLQRVHDSRP